MAHERAEVIAPHELLIRRIEVFERLAAHEPSQRPPDIAGEVRDQGGNSGLGSAIAFRVNGPAIVVRLPRAPEIFGLLILPISEPNAENGVGNFQRPERTRQMVMVDDVDLLSRART